MSVNGNAPPVAIAGPTQVVAEGAVVQLDGSASFDPDPEFIGSCPATADFPNELKWKWIFNTKPAGSTAALIPAAVFPADPLSSTVPNPTFTADKAGVYVLQLVVNDCIVNSESSIVSVRTFNTTPIANAGPDQSNVAEGATVSLNGTASNDPDGDPITYQWTFFQRPAASQAVLFNPTSSTPTFVADNAGRYVVRLVVSDGFATSVFDEVVVRTPNRLPVANAGADRVGTVGQLVNVPGSGSDPDSDPLTYSWTLVSQPAGSAITLSNPTNATTSFTPLVGGQYTLRLVVSDGTAFSDPDDVVVNVTTGNIVLTLVQPGLLGVGRQNTVLIDLTAPAPTGGTTVTLLSDDPGIVSVAAPGTVFIAQGQSHGQITINAVAPGSTFVRGTAPTYIDGSVTVSVTAKLITLPAAPTIAIGISSVLPISIGPGPAPAPGVSINVTSADPTRVEVLTPIVTVPTGAFSVNATVRGLAGGTVAVTATSQDYAFATTNVTSTGNLNILEASVTMTPGFPGSIRVQLESTGSPLIVPPPGLTVGLTAANPACLSVPATTTIPAGQTFVQQVLAYGGTASLPCTTSVSASATGLTSDSINVTVNPNPGMTVFGPAGGAFGVRYLGAGLQDGAYFFRLGTSNHGGVTVRITSSDATKLLVAPNATTAGTAFIDVPVANGATDASFYLQGVEGQTGAVTVTAAAPGFTGLTSGIINVVTPALSFLRNGLGFSPILISSTTALSTDSPFLVFIGVPDDAGTDLRIQSGTGRTQAVRAGGTARTVTVTSSTPATGLGKTLSGAATPVTVTIPVGASQTAATVAAGGVAFDPVAGGTTTIAATIPGFISLPEASRVVTVTAPGMTLNGPGGSAFGAPRYVGAGLQDGAYIFRLEASDHGGVTVRITSSDATKLLVAPNATTAGTAFIDVAVANGATDANFYLQGVEGQTGAVTVTAAAPGFTGLTSGIINVVTPALSFLRNGLGFSPILISSTTALSTDSPFLVFIGVPDDAGTDLRIQSGAGRTQAVRAGGTARTVTVTSSTPATGLGKTLSGAATPVTVTIPVGASQTAATVAAGGVAFDPLAGGTTTIAATIPGFISLPEASRVVTVTAPGMTLNGPGGSAFGAPRYVGAGLQDGAYVFRLDASNHGGVTVRITSSDATKLLVAPNATTAGTAFIDVAVANGATDANFYLQGVEGQTGAVTVTAAAPGFTGLTSGIINVVTPALSFLRNGLGFSPILISTTTALSTDSPFLVFIGVPDDAGTDLRIQSGAGRTQAVRAGGTARTVTVTSSTPATGLGKTLSGAATPVTVTIPVGASQTAATVAAGGVAFDPLAGGTTTVAATIPGFISLPEASRVVTVTAPGMTVFGPAGGAFGVRYLGAGLQDGAYVFRLDASNHGGVTVRITSSDATKLLVAPNATTAGTAFIDVAVANGATDANFYLQGVEGQAGSVTVTAAAPGFTGLTSGIINVVTPALSFLRNGLGLSPILISSTTALSTDSPFLVFIGVPDDAGTDLRIQSGTGRTQAVRAGGTARTVTVTSSTPATGLGKTLSGAATPVTVTIPVGASQTAATVAAGGVAFDPVAGGTTTIAATIPGFIALPEASRVVTVTTPGITVLGPSSTSFGTRFLGAGLQDGAFIVRLEASGHGGVTVRVTSSDATKLLVAPNATTAGTAFVDLPVANGATDGTFYLQGVEGQLGTATVTATVTGFTSATSGTVNIVTPGYRLTSLPSSIAATGATTVFFVEVGPPTANGSDLLSQSGTGALQAVRPGGLFTATVTNSNAVGAQLIAASGGAQSWAVNILAGQDRTAATTGTGGIAFDPLSGACSATGCDTFVEADIPGLVKTTVATRTVRVTP